MTQIDPSVLSELPEALRACIEKRAIEESKRKRKDRCDVRKMNSDDTDSDIEDRRERQPFVRLEDARERLERFLNPHVASMQDSGELVRFETSACDLVVHMVECGNLEGVSALMRSLARTLAGDDMPSHVRNVLRRIEEALQLASKRAYGCGISWR